MDRRASSTHDRVRRVGVHFFFALTSIVSLNACTRLACVAPETCASICAGSGATSRGFLGDACQCVVSCDLGMCSSVAYCPP